ncbi:hypothetical protein ABMA32_03625 [Mesorhizobium sp. VNQ89]|uniref:hypothetical protein n=1 Tax=Mesorhizobium quangtriensis TaxID=3157709 RepID=UPI0032B80881
MNAADAKIKLPSIQERVDFPAFNSTFEDILTADADTPSDALALVSVARHLLTETIQATPKGSNASIFALYAWAHITRAVEALERSTGEKAISTVTTGQAN